MASERSTGYSLQGGDEYDMLTKARQFHKRRPGDAKKAKATFNRRVRRGGKRDTRTADPVDGSDTLDPLG